MMSSKVFHPKRKKVCIINCACVLSYVGLNFARTEYSGWKMSNIAFRFEAKIRLILNITRKGKFLSWDPTTSGLIWRCYERKCFENVDYHFNLRLSYFCLKKRKKNACTQVWWRKNASDFLVKNLEDDAHIHYHKLSKRDSAHRIQEMTPFPPLFIINTTAWFQERGIDAGNTAQLIVL